jgi:hypothetical protein
MSSKAMDQDVVSDVARALLERAAIAEPDQVAAERRMFTVLSQAYFADAQRALTGGDRGGRQLAFGPPGTEELLTPVFLAAATQVVAFLVERGVVASGRGMRRLLRTRNSADAAETGPAVPELTGEQWVQIRGIVAQALVTHGQMAPQRADLIAAAVVGDGLTGPQ